MFQVSNSRSNDSNPSCSTVDDDDKIKETIVVVRRSDCSWSLYHDLYIEDDKIKEAIVDDDDKIKSFVFHSVRCKNDQ
ncbi:hypothetical protein E3N88_24277 [Mikania micrantha]|uniref:Uncharacterized protein n=1 Tax=Mikania micrantha TaxID=192012 RepID=A0A5N6NFJ6_9ASTR|nr:hypothetical protein E3N88_24277 [Mikania micrantha]